MTALPYSLQDFLRLHNTPPVATTPPARYTAWKPTEESKECPF
jgi:hypothetical protein